jgi:hypothetical protein
LLLKKGPAPGLKVCQGLGGLFVGFLGCRETFLMFGQPFLKDVEIP